MAAKPFPIAFYLPQFHPIRENDLFWGKGFTEWSHVQKARPLFEGHLQPRVPAPEIGYYDLRDSKVLSYQGKLARNFGIEAFCYWHYWFNGHLVLQKPLEDMLASQETDMPFCLGWANESWTGKWHGIPEKILIEQTYPGQEDHRKHFKYLERFFCDPRYIRVEGKPLLILYRPEQIPHLEKFLSFWKELALKKGLKGLYILGFSQTSKLRDVSQLDGLLWANPYWGNQPQNSAIPQVTEYETYIEAAELMFETSLRTLPIVIPNWDTTPRLGRSGLVLKNSTPSAFQSHLKRTIRQTQSRNESPLLFIKSWNEWGEGNFLEPDTLYGNSYLKAVQSACHEYLS